MAKTHVEVAGKEIHSEKIYKCTKSPTKKKDHSKKDQCKKMLFTFELQDINGSEVFEGGMTLYLGMASRPYWKNS